MDVLALILALAAMVLFLVETPRRRTVATDLALLPLGLALLAASWICQATTITDNLVNF